MANINKFVFLGNPDLGLTANFTIKVPGISGVSNLTFVNPVTNASTQALRGVDRSASSSNLGSFLTNYVTNVSPFLQPYSTVVTYSEGGNPVSELTVDYVKTYRYKLEFYNNAVVDKTIKFEVKKNGAVLKAYDKTFASTSTSLLTPIGTTADATSALLRTNLQSFNANQFIKYSVSPDVNAFGLKDIYIDVEANPTDSMTINIISNTTSSVNISGPTLLPNVDKVTTYFISSGTTSATTSTGTTAISTALDLRVRSSHIIKAFAPTTANTFSETTFTIRAFEGNINTGAAQPISYVKTKQKLVASQNNIWITPSNLLKENLEGNINSFRANNYFTAQSLGPKESKWAQINVQNFNLGTATTSAVTYNFIVDGYIEPTEEQGLPNILLTGDKRYVNKASVSRVYFKTKNLVTATYATQFGLPVAIGFSNEPEINTNYVQSVRINIQNPLNNFIDYTFSYLDGIVNTVRFNFYDADCKYENYTLVFKNKYGMLESISMSKKSVKMLTTKQDDYLRGIVNYEGDFDIARHTNKQFNVTGTEEWTLNTETLPEYMNSVIKEMQLTEELWIMDNAFNLIPVIKTEDSLTYKQGINRDQIQYTMKVKLSHNIIKNII